MLSTLLDLLGFACFVAGAYLIWPIAALFVGGVCLLLVAASVEGVKFSNPFKKARK